ncbi:MAG: hypothetical protein ACREIT_05910 [Tepidisphaeraceae bacterium]
MPPLQQDLRATAWSFALVAIATVLCHAAGGGTLGLFLGPLLFAAILAPPLVVAEEGLRSKLFAAAGACDGVGVVWLASVLAGVISFGQWAQCVLIVAGVVTLAGGLGLALRRVGVHGVIASALAVVVGLAWVTWPVWLSPWLAGREAWVEWLAWAHPVMAINAAVAHLGVWSEQTVAYRLTNLGQDVAYQLPSTMWPSAVSHLVVGAALFWWGGVAKRASRSINRIDPTATTERTA